MPDEFDYDEDSDEGEDERSLPAKLRRQLKEANARAKAFEEQAAANAGAARRVAFQDANIPDTPQAKYFREKYDGEMSSEAIRAAATEYGFVTDQSPEAQASMDAVAAQSDAAAGAQGLITTDQGEYERAIEEAVSQAEPGREAQAIAEVYTRFSA
jgi:hypothetical protein